MAPFLTNIRPVSCLQRVRAEEDTSHIAASEEPTVMPTPKRLSGSQVKSATYGEFNRSGVTVDVRSFLNTSSGKSLMSQMRDARTGQVRPKSAK